MVPRYISSEAVPSLRRFAHRFAPPTVSISLRSSLRARLSFLLAQENDGFRSYAWVAKSPWVASDPVGIADSHPLRSMLIDVCLRRHQWRSSEPESPIPIARSHTIVICKGNCARTPSLKSAY